MRQFKGLTSIGGKDLSTIPQALFDNLGLFYTARDIGILEFMGHGDMDRTFTIESLNSRFEKSDVQDAYKRGIISKFKDENTHYVISALTLPINIFATHMPEKWNNIEKQDRDAIAAWHYDCFLEDKRAMGLEGMRKNKNRVAPLDEVIEHVKNMDAPITLINCDCKAKFQRCSFDRNICIEFGSGPNTSQDRGWGKPLTKDETIELLKKTEQMGLVHSIEALAICNCCTCCCYPIRGSFALDLVHTWPEHEYQVVMDIDECISCGECVERCQFGVFREDDDEVRADTDKCWGCGICVGTCPVEALALEKK